MSKRARDLGEPLEREVISPHETPVVFDKRRNLLLKEDLDIVVERANALRGCPDPKLEVETGKAALEVVALFLEMSSKEDIVLTDDDGGTSPICGSVLEMKAREIFEKIGWPRYHEIVGTMNRARPKR